MADLKPCPFCGGAAVLRSRPNVTASNDPGEFGVDCTGCNTRARHSRSEEGAAEFWNRRAPLAPPTDTEVEALTKVLIDYNGLPHDSIGKRIAMGKARAALAAFVAGRTGG